ncbi:SRPBCC family protein [Devosia sp. A16]|uniref:SRPBCC family protein n=1 Tax=Devosia sp. A16 TaxID=1736675 RepID=UPI0006D76BAA|nr:SRPBCC family protein [Devosia sp. A16]
MQRPKVIALSDYRRQRDGEALRQNLEQGAGTPHWFVLYWRYWAESLDRLDAYLKQLKELKMALDNLKIDAPANEPIVIATRDFAAPRALVWRVMTEREHVARWWGTEGQRNVITALDVRPGGKWRIESHAADGNVYIFVGEYREVHEPEKFVWTFGMENMFFGKTLVETHTFEEDGAVTHYRSVSNYDSIADRDGMVASGMEKGMRHGFAVMDQLLAELTQEA